ncbi:hypothetical protein WH47_09621 [Habropoda laboriosa]|uniref:Centriolar and ciliogenesis-associated protein HYLS1 C-terminal domain-containing protein n=1 Tax=Habropoda laboriosa TaxID=597456 RepID=A0A0L7RE14_9HYME|nr:PREDICTED: uncharacterized protein LOC108579250 [Habropoda laboriosa]KOC69064.1 hypothetical protein WH47_09621 [Habropoda laboriosa]
MYDDPREVLVLLNSLGFVGITAEQLKAFMKDLKLYRKMKDRERQQRKEEIKKKILDKQQNMIREILREQNAELHSVENTITSNSSNSYINDSLVKVKVKCLSSDKENRNFISSEESYTNTRQKVDMSKFNSKSRRTVDHCSVKSSSMSYDNDDDKIYIRTKDNHVKCLKTDFQQSKTKDENDKILYQERLTHLETLRPMSAPNILQHQQEYIGSSQTKSSSSTKNINSGTKSFIRPWRLQPEAQKNLNAKKSDPVMLYQKYQQEWKQISFPGEAKHANVRWAIRAKMLGGDPHPMPLPRKSTSMPILKRK